MSDDGFGNRAIQWNKGRLRAESDASKCVHLNHSIDIHLTPMKVASPIQTPGNDGMVIAKLNGPPTVSLICDSPEVVEMYTRGIGPDLAMQVRQCGRIRVDLQYCRGCTFWQVAKKQESVVQ
jgi:hypothetical protein